MSGLKLTEPGSPVSLFAFHAWCRVQLALAAFLGQTPEFLFQNGPDPDETSAHAWKLEGHPDSARHVLETVIPGWIKSTAASQVGMSVIIPAEEPGVLLVTADETGAFAESAYVEIVRDRLEFREWTPETTEVFSVQDWQRVLAQNAGYRNLAKWRCQNCESVCCGEVDSDMAPCDYCGCEEVEPVPLETPLEPPLPPHDEEYDYAERYPDPTIAGEILDVILGLQESCPTISLDRSRRWCSRSANRRLTRKTARRRPSVRVRH